MNVIVCPDVELWAYQYLTDALGDRGESYADATVTVRLPETLPDRAVWVRRDGGPREDMLYTAARLSVNVLTRTEQDASDLSRLVEGLLLAARATEPVSSVRSLSGPSVIADPSGRPRRYFTVEVTLRGTVT